MVEDAQWYAGFVTRYGTDVFYFGRCGTRESWRVWETDGVFGPGDGGEEGETYYAEVCATVWGEGTQMTDIQWDRDAAISEAFFVSEEAPDTCDVLPPLE
jgi:hypothetical protein